MTSSRGTCRRRVPRLRAWRRPMASSPTPGARPARIPVAFAEVRPWRTSRTVVMDAKRSDFLTEGAIMPM